MEKNNTKTKFYLTLIIFSLIGQVAWVVENMYFNVFLYNMFAASADEISLMVSLSAVSATLTTLLVGAFADKVGKRKIFICLGYILWGVSILGFALIRTDIIGAAFPTAVSVSAICITLVIIMDCVMTFFGSSANDACFNAWLTDVTTSDNRGKAEGINAMMPLLAILVVFGGAMVLGFDDKDANGWTTMFVIIGAVVILIGIAGFFLIKDPKLETAQNENYFKNIIYGFRPSVIKENLGLYAYLCAFAVFGISIQTFMPYLILYYQELLGDAYVFIMAPAIILAGIFTFFWGRVYDKWGFNKSIVPSIALLVVGYIILMLWTNTALVAIGSLLMMCGYLSGMAVFGAIIRDKTPENKSGMFQGLRIVGQVLIPGIIGPAIGAWVLSDAETREINGVETFIPNQSIFVAALVVAVALIGLLALLSVIKNKRKELSNEGK